MRRYEQALLSPDDLKARKATKEGVLKSIRDLFACFSEFETARAALIVSRCRSKVTRSGAKSSYHVFVDTVYRAGGLKVPKHVAIDAMAAVENTLDYALAVWNNRSDRAQFAPYEPPGLLRYYTGEAPHRAYLKERVQARKNKINEALRAAVKETFEELFGGWKGLTVYTHTHYDFKKGGYQYPADFVISRDDLHVHPNFIAVPQPYPGNGCTATRPYLLLRKVEPIVINFKPTDEELDLRAYHALLLTRVGSTANPKWTTTLGVYLRCRILFRGEPRTICAAGETFQTALKNLRDHQNTKVVRSIAIDKVRSDVRKGMQVLAQLRKGSRSITSLDFRELVHASEALQKDMDRMLQAGSVELLDDAGLRTL